MEASNGMAVNAPSTRRVWVLVVAVMAALVVAASSDTVRIWTNPSPSADQPSAVVDRGDSPSRTVDEPGEGARYPWIGAVLQVVAMAVFGVIVLAGLITAVRSRPTFRTWRWSPPNRRRPEFGAPLPDAIDRPVRVDAEAARATLTAGPPRNAIVECWTQLERDIAAAGLPRRPAETSTELVERVIGGASLDPAPISELAALYREARFSLHDLGPDHRDRAMRALERVVAALAAEVPA